MLVNLPGHFEILVALVFCGAAYSDVPPPWETPVEVVVSGRTSTLKKITIVKVGQEIPRTYAGSKMNNTPGFTWYVSQHYALKSQMDESFSHRMLEVSELAYPHWVQLIGREPAGIEYTRMAIVYAKNRKEVDTAVGTDFGTFWAGGGGGVTFPHNKSAYNYPSGGLRYHKRDLVIHENVHMLQFCAVAGKAPGRFVEGVSHGASNHVYDEAKKQLTVAVFDKATVNNPIDSQLAGMRKRFFTMQEFLDGAPGQPIALYSHFFWTDPERLLKWRLWRDGLFALKPWDDMVENDTALMLEIFGPMARLESEWKRWIGERHNSFHFVEWGWEQSADTLWSYGYPWDKSAHSRTNIRYSPSMKPPPDPLRLDFPASPVSPLVGPVGLGVPEPAVGALIDFSQNPSAGVAGLAFGVEDKSYCPVFISGSKEIVVGGYKFGLKKQTFPIAPSVQKAASQNGHRFGLTVKVARNSLQVVVRAGSVDAMHDTKIEVPLTDAQRSKIMENHMAVLSKGSRHGVTPYWGVASPAVDLTQPAPPNRWRFQGLDSLYGLYKAEFRLGSKTPQSLVTLRDRMLAAVTGPPDIQAAAIESYEAEIRPVMRDIRSSGADSIAIAEALADLTGLWLDLRVTEASVPGHLQLTASLGGLLSKEVTGHLNFLVTPANTVLVSPEPEPVSLLPGAQINTLRCYRLSAEGEGPFTISATAELVWRDERLILTAKQGCRTSISSWHVVGPFNNPGGGAKDIKHAVEQEKYNPRKSFEGRGGTVSWQPLNARRRSSVQDEVMVDFDKIYGGSDVAAYAHANIGCPVDTDAMLLLGSDDGVVAWLNGRRIHQNLVSRGYTSQQDSVRIKLVKGTNSLLVKVAQGNGGWQMAAHILGVNGNPIPGLKYE